MLRLRRKAELECKNKTQQVLSVLKRSKKKPKYHRDEYFCLSLTHSERTQA